MISEKLPSQTQERLPIPPDSCVLFPDPAFLFEVAYSKLYKEKKLPLPSVPKEYVYDLLTKTALGVLPEYESILSILRNLVGQERVLLVRKCVVTAKEDKSTGALKFDESFFPDLGSEHITIRTDSNHASLWTRDGFSTIGQFVFLNPRHFKDIYESEFVRYSKLGEGGMVLHSQKSVLVSSTLWKERKTDLGLGILQYMGYKIAPLPLVDHKKQRYEFKEDHIDGHAALITDTSGEPHLLVAQSYSRQGNDTRKKIFFAAETIGAKVIEIDDRNLPPLPLNLVQFDDTSVLVSRGMTNDLTIPLQFLVGKDKVFATEVPIIEIPHMTGSIRCLVNIIPRSVLEVLMVQKK